MAFTRCPDGKRKILGNDERMPFFLLVFLVLCLSQIGEL